jgi:hypothetical protein
VYLSVDDKRGEVSVLIDASRAVIEALRPQECDFRCNAAQGCGHSLGATPFIPDVQNLHAI